MLFDCLSLWTDAKSQAKGVKHILEDSKLNERREELRAVTDNTAMLPKTCELLEMEQVPYCAWVSAVAPIQEDIVVG